MTNPEQQPELRAPRRTLCFLGTARARIPEPVTARDAPFPEEHQESRTGSGEILHIRWIPDTTTTRYITEGSALNLHHEDLGEAGDWHRAGWWVPASHADPDIHFALLSDHDICREALHEIIDLLGDTELVDCRPVLKELPHPAGRRDRPVWCATHVRAILEKAWWNMREEERRDPGVTLKAVDPSTVARWLATRDQWIQLHNLGDQIGSALAPRHGLQAPWREWLACQTPLAHYTNPGERWDIDRLDRLAMEEGPHG